MSLEQKIEALTAAILANTAALQAQQQAAPAVPQAAQMTVPQPTPAPAVNPAMNATPMGMYQAPVAAMPPLPSFAAPVAPAAPAAPFADLGGLVKYATEAYGMLEAKAAGSGVGIQNVITHLGHQNINDIKPEQYGAFFQAVESLKAA